MIPTRSPKLISADRSFGRLFLRSTAAVAFASLPFSAKRVSFLSSFSPYLLSSFPHLLISVGVRGAFISCAKRVVSIGQTRRDVSNGRLKLNALRRTRFSNFQLAVSPLSLRPPNAPLSRTSRQFPNAPQHKPSNATTYANQIFRADRLAAQVKRRVLRRPQRQPSNGRIIPNARRESSNASFPPSAPVVSTSPAKSLSGRRQLPMENFGASDASLQRLPRARPKLALFPWHVRSTRSFPAFPLSLSRRCFQARKNERPSRRQGAFVENRRLRASGARRVKSRSSKRRNARDGARSLSVRPSRGLQKEGAKGASRRRRTRASKRPRSRRNPTAPADPSRSPFPY